MRKFALVATTLALTGCLALTACNQQSSDQPTTVKAAQLTKPADPNDGKAWNAYLGQIVQANMQGMTADRPYAYMVPAGDSDDAKAGSDRQLSAVQDIIARGVLPGNMLVFGGPDSGKTVDFVTAAFKDAKPGTFKNVIVLVIGDKADEQKIAAVLQPTGATIRFVAFQ
jgi:hypothetical protein